MWKVWKGVQDKIITFSSLIKKHGKVDLIKLKLKNEHLSLKIDLYLEQIKFLKDLIIIQESLKNPKVRPSQKTIENNHSSTSPIPSIE